MNVRQLRVCYFGTYRSGYVRNRLMIARLRDAGIAVIECHAALWEKEEDRISAAIGKWIKPAFIWRFIYQYCVLLFKYFRLKDHDIIMIGYPGQIDVFLAWFLSLLRKKILIWDILMSLYLIVIERGLDIKHPPTAKLLYQIEKIGCKLPDLIISDTKAYRDWYAATYNIPLNKFDLIPLGADDRYFFPSATKKISSHLFTVLYHGSFVPSHGLQYIIQATILLREHADIQFILIGDGPEKSTISKQVQQNCLTNIKMIGWLDNADLIEYIESADLLLGTFGNTTQSLITVQNKIYEAFAMAKPIITGESPALLEIFEHKKNIYLVNRCNGQALADAILLLKGEPNLRDSLSRNAYILFKEKYSFSHLGESLSKLLHQSITAKQEKFNIPDS